MQKEVKTGNSAYSVSRMNKENHRGDGFDVKNLIFKLGDNLHKKEIAELDPILMKAVIRESG